MLEPLLEISVQLPSKIRLADSVKPETSLWSKAACRCLSWEPRLRAETTPTELALGRTTVRALAVIPPRARSTLRRPKHSPFLLDQDHGREISPQRFRSHAVLRSPVSSGVGGVVESDFRLQSFFENRTQAHLSGVGERRSPVINFRADPGDMLGKRATGMKSHPIPNIVP